MTAPPLPIVSFWQRFKLARAVPPATVGGDGFGWGERMGDGKGKTDVPQTVIASFGLQLEEGVTPRYTHFGIQVAIWHTNPQTALLREQEALLYYSQFQDVSSGSRGLTFTGWTAQRVYLTQHGIIDSIPIEGGFLYKVTIDLHLVNLKQI